MRRALLLLSLVAGCRAGELPDPCADVSGSCVSLTVESGTVTEVDTLHLVATGAISGERDSAKGQVSSLPIKVALQAPAGLSGEVHLSVTGLVRGQTQGTGETDFTLTDGQHVPVTVELLGGETPTPDLSVSPDPADLSCGPLDRPQNCGACGHDCTQLPHVTGAGVTCSNGACVVPPSACQAGWARCSTNADDGCETDLTQAAHCGACTTVCSGGTPLCTSSGSGFACVANCGGATPDNCSNSCVNLQNDPQHCKTCSTMCSFPHAGASCSSGVCTVGACGSGYMDCVNGPADGCETYTAGDPLNCGACNHKCLVGQVCSSGSCLDNQVTCSSAGAACAQAYCFDAGHFAVTTGIVVNLLNGRRLWERVLGASGAKVNFNTAHNYCATLVLEGVTGWRLPTYAELASVAYKTGGLMGCPTNKGYCDPAWDQAAFTGVGAGVGPYVWSSDQYTASSPPSYYTYFYCDGRKNYPDDPSTGMDYVRCTRDPLP